MALLLGLVGCALFGCSQAGPNDKTVSGDEINASRDKAMDPGDREKLDALRNEAAIPGGGDR